MFHPLRRQALHQTKNISQRWISSTAKRRHQYSNLSRFKVQKPKSKWIRKTATFLAAYTITGYTAVQIYHRGKLNLTRFGNSPFVLYPISFFQAHHRVLASYYALATIYGDYYFTKKYYEYKGQTGKQLRKSLHFAHERGAERLLSTLLSLGGVFIKMGQELSLMKGILPIEYTNKLSVLQDRVEFGVDLAYVDQIFFGEFEKSLDEVFSDFSVTPIAAASLAQVHSAKLKDGTEVAVKIQYPQMKIFLPIDLFIHETASRIYAKLNTDFQYNDKAQQNIYQHLKDELDFSIEARNAMRCKENFKDNPKVYVPKIYEEYISPNVLTMEFVHGFKVNNHEEIKKHNWKKVDIANTLISALSDQIFKHGFIHADPHPGNVFLRPLPSNPKDFQVILLDHGLYSEIGEPFRIKFATLWKSLVLGKTAKVNEICAGLGIKHADLFVMMMLMQQYDGVDKRLEDQLHKQFFDANRDEDDDTPSDPMLENFTVMADAKQKEFMEMGASIPQEIHLIMRAMFITRMLNVELGAPVNRFNLMAKSAYPYAEDSVVGSSWGFTWQLRWMDFKTWSVVKLVNFLSVFSFFPKITQFFVHKNLKPTTTQKE